MKLPSDGHVSAIDHCLAICFLCRPLAPTPFRTILPDLQPNPSHSSYPSHARFFTLSSLTTMHTYTYKHCIKTNMNLFADTILRHILMHIYLELFGMVGWAGHSIESRFFLFFFLSLSMIFVLCLECNNHN